MSDDDNKTNNDSNGENLDAETGLTEDELWGGRKPTMYEPDFSDVRKKIFSPVKIIIFVFVSAAFWLLFYLLLGSGE